MNWKDRLSGMAIGAVLMAGVFGGFGCCSVPQAFVKASRATADAIGADFKAYVASDPALDDQQKATRYTTLELWYAAIEAAERDNGGEK